MSLIFYDNWISRVAQIPFVDGVDPPNKNDFKLIFLVDTVNNPNDSRAAIFAREVLDCPRFIVTFTGPGTFNLSNRRHTLPNVVINLSHSEDRQFDTAVLLANCPFTHSTIEVDSIDITDNILETTENHGLSQDDPVMLANLLDQFPSPINGNTLYYADIVSANEIKLLDSPGGSEIDLTGSYSPVEPLLIRPAVGDFVFYKAESITVTIPNTGFVPYTIRLGKEQS